MSLQCSHGNGYPPQSRGRNPDGKIEVSCVVGQEPLEFLSYLPNEGLDATGTTVGLVESNFTNDLVAVLPKLIGIPGQLFVVPIGHYVTYLRSFLTFSIWAGRLSAKVSLRD